jgi:polysaccharide biosynthesis protein PslG
LVVLRLASLPALVASALVAVVLAAPADAGVPRGFVGITADDVFAGNDNHRTANLSAMAAIGIQTIRQTFDWSTIERSPGVYDFSYHDAYVAKVSAHGLRVLPVLVNPPSFYRPTRGRAACPPRDMATFARFAKAVVRRYGRRGSLWRNGRVPGNPITAYQIWNEPNLSVYSCNRRPKARRYVAMLRTVGRAIKRVDRRAQVVSAGIPPSKLKSAVPIERYIAQMYRAGARRYFDSLAINSYAKDGGQLRGILRSIRRLMNRHGDRRGRIWVTEFGWGDTGPKHRFIVGAAGQARRITQAFDVIRQLRHRLRLSGVIYYSWRDAPPYPLQYRDLWGLHTGLLDINGGFKPAFYAFKNGVARLR